MNFALVLIPMLISLSFAIGIIILVIYWVTKIIRLKEEQNNLLKESVQKFE